MGLLRKVGAYFLPHFYSSRPLGDTARFVALTSKLVRYIAIALISNDGKEVDTGRL